MRKQQVLPQLNGSGRKYLRAKFPQIKVSLDAAVYRELHKIGVNLNQVFKAMHTGNLGVKIPGRVR